MNIKLPKLPSIPGDEGVGDIVEVGSLVSRVAVGERVVLSRRLLGSWRFYGIFHECDVHVIAKNISLPEAAMLTIAPCSAYRMIYDFRQLKPGDTVAQNGANSPCGQSVIQLCKTRGINTLNIVANQVNFHTVKDYLLKIGASVVYTLEEAEALAFDTSLSRPKLALNCLGGRYEDVMLNLLERNGDIVYYGMAYYLPWIKQSFRCDVKFHKFHIHDWEARTSRVEKDVMYKKIIQQIVTGDFRAPVYHPIELKDYVEALRNTETSAAFGTINYIFDFTMTY